jgi:LTXXQ motif family protein
MRQEIPVQGTGGCRAGNLTEWRSIMKRATKIAIGVATALSFGLATAVVSAHPYGDGPGWGIGQGMGYGPAAGMGQGMGGRGPMGAEPMGYGPMGNGPMGRGPMMGHGMGPHAFANPGAAAESRLAGMKSELKITATQESAWKAFADQAKERAEAMQALMTSAQGSAQATAPERLELRIQMMKKRQEQMEKGTAAFKDLYAVLTPEQKALADQHFGMMGGRGMAFNMPAK